LDKNKKKEIENGESGKSKKDEKEKVLCTYF